MKTNVEENNNAAFKTYCNNQFIQLDVNLRKNNGRELFVKILNAMKATLVQPQVEILYSK